MVKVGNGNPPRWQPKVIVSKMSKNPQSGSPTIRPERQRQLQGAISKLYSEKNTSPDPSEFAALIVTLVPKILPGKSVRLDLLRSEQEKVFSSIRFGSERSYAYSGEELDITSIFQRKREEEGGTGNPDFIAAMQAMSARGEVTINGEGRIQCLALPLLDRENKVLGSLTLSNQTGNKISPITDEDKEVFRLYAKKTGELLNQERQNPVLEKQAQNMTPEKGSGTPGEPINYGKSAADWLLTAEGRDILIEHLTIRLFETIDHPIVSLSSMMFEAVHPGDPLVKEAKELRHELVEARVRIKKLKTQVAQLRQEGQTDVLTVSSTRGHGMKEKVSELLRRVLPSAVLEAINRKSAVFRDNIVRPIGGTEDKAARMKSLQAAFAQLDSVGNSPDRIGMLMTSLLSQTMPGKRLARIDLLEYAEQGQVFSSVHVEAPDGSVGFSGMKLDVTPVVADKRIKISNGDPDFIAAMQAMNTRREFTVNGDNWERFLGLPLLGPDNKVLGSLVLSNRSWNNVSPITPEDRETFRQFAIKISELLAPPSLKPLK